MRTGAIFARGSCRALTWTALLGAFLVLGSVQAAAQMPEIEDAEYTATQLMSVVVTMTEPVYGSGAVELLPGDFMLDDGADEAADTAAFRIDGLEGSRLTADNTFTVVFNKEVKGHAIYYAASAYATPPVTGTQARSILNRRGDPFGGTTDGTAGDGAGRDNAVEVRGPEQTRELTLDIDDERMDLEAARKRGQVYAHYRAYVDTAAGQKAAIELPAAEGPPGTPMSGDAAIKYMLESSRLSINPSATIPANLTELHFQHTAATATTSEIRALSGKLTDIVGDYDITYTAYTGVDLASATARDSVTFTLKVADVPEAPTITRVETASNSSIKVTWSAPRSDNNDTITHYELRYRLDDHVTWTKVATTSAVTSYTLAGLDPGLYEVQARAINSIAAAMTGYDDKGWSETVEGSTGTGAQKPTLTVTVNKELPEGRDTIPVTITATVEPSAESSRALSVTLALVKQKTSNTETNAELPAKTNAPANPDVMWDMPASDPAMSKAIEFRFTSNLSGEQTVYLKTAHDVDAEPEKFRIKATATAVPNDFSKAEVTTTDITVKDDEVQVYELGLPYQLEADKKFMEGYGGSTIPVNLMVTPPRTVATNYIVSLTSKEDASDYSLLSPSSGSPSSVGTRVSLSARSPGEELKLTPVQNDGDRMDDTITLQLFKANAAGVKGAQLGDDIVLTVTDRHMLPMVTRGSIMVDGAAATTIAEGQKATIELMADRGTTTDAIPDNESVKVMLSLAATSEANADDFRLGSATVDLGTKKMETFELEALVDDADVEDEMLVLQAEVTGTAANGPGTTVDLAAITITDGTMKLVWAKMQDVVETAIYDAKMAGMGDDEMLTAGEMIEVMGSALFNNAEGVTLSYSAESSDAAVASTAASNGSVTVTAAGEGDAMITITAHASMPSSVKINDQTDPREASITFPVEVGLEALSFMLKGPDDMNIVEGGAAHANGTMGAAMLTVTANRAVAMDTEVMIMRDRSLSTAMDSDFMPSPAMITIKSGEMMGSVEITATEDSMAEDMEELVLYAMVGDMMVEGQVKLYIWDAAVPALPILAQLLLAAFLAIGGYRRYLRR